MITESGFRSYEVYQRERVGETTNLVSPRDALGEEYLGDPFTLPGIMRENYPCYRDWVANRFWITRYDDVTSVFADDANFESRPRRLAYGAEVTGRDLGQDPAIQQAWVEMTDEVLELTVARVLDDLAGNGAPPDLTAKLADRLAADLFGAVTGFGELTPEVLVLLGQVRAGCGWSEVERVAGLRAFGELRRLIGACLADRKKMPAADLLTAFADLGAASDDIAITLLESDYTTLPASLANAWCLLLSHDDQLRAVKADPRLMKFAYLEALRHSPPVVTADRFTRHEVERFGRLVPTGATLHLSAAAANRDPRQFTHADEFDITRKDLCQREPRGHYRADGLPSGIAFGHGKPSRLPALPRDAPRSRYALTRDVAVAASLALLDRFPNLTLAADASPTMALNRLGGTYRCRYLPVDLDAG